MRSIDPVVMSQLRPARRLLLVTVAAGCVQAVLLVAQAFVLAGGVVAMVDGRAVATWVAALLLVSAARAAMSYVSDDTAGRAAARVGFTLRHRLLSHVMRSEHDESRTAASTAVLATRGVQETEPYLTRYLPSLILAAVLPPITVVAIATQDVLSAVIVLATIPLIPLFAALVGWRTRDRAARQWRQLALLAGHFLDVVRGLPTLVAYRRADHQTGTIRTITNRYRVATIATLRLAFASSAVLELIATISVALVAVSVGLRLNDGSLDLETALVVLLLAPEAYWPIRRVGAEFHAAAQGAAAFADAGRLLAAETAAHGPFAANPTLVDGLELTLDGATVRFPGHTEPALRATSATLRGPGLVAITGASGAGKSTLLAAVQGRLPLSDGEIAVNGTPTGRLEPDWWHAQVSWSPQRPYFVRGSIADNLRLGRPDAKDGELWCALQLVGLAALVSALPADLSSDLDEDGLSLSGGERARLALARVVVAGRPLVLLDEPSAHLDPESEAVVAATIEHLATTALVLVVTHRPAIANAAQQVIALVPSPRPLAPASPAPTVTNGRSRATGLASAAASPTSPTTTPVEDADPRRTKRLIALSTVLGALASASGIALTATAGWLIVKASTHPPVLVLMVAIVGVRTFGIARPVLRYAERLVSHDGALRLLAEKRTAVYAALVPLTPGRLGRRRGDVLASVVDDVESHVDRRLRVSMPLATLALTGALVLAVTAFVLPAAAGINLLLLLAAGLGPLVLVRLGVGRCDAAWVAARARLTERVTELAEGSLELRAWGAGDRALALVDGDSERTERLLARSTRRAAAGRAAILLLVGLAVSASLVVLAGAVTEGRLAGATAALLLLVPLAMTDILLPVPDAAVADVRTRSALARLDALLDQTPAVLETPDPRPLDLRGDLAARDVTAGWGGQPAFEHLDLELPQRSRVALVGPSGSGKSTLAALLVRFIDPMRGDIRYAGSDLRSCSLDDVRRTVGLLDDDPHIFSTTLAENIRFARPEASDEELATALRSTSMGAWLDALPQGLDTWLGEGNRSVSGGERARIAMARVVLADQPVVVLDEPTAHLDHQTADEVMASLFAGASRRSVLLITHRTEGLDLVDHVVSLAGRARSTGSPEPGATPPDLAAALTANA